MIAGDGAWVRMSGCWAGRLALVCLLVSALAACGGGGGDPAPTTPATPAASTPSQPTTPQPPAQPPSTPASQPPAEPPATKPGVMAISASMRLEPFPTTVEQYLAVAEEAVNLSYSAGSRGQMTTYTWKKLEPTQGSYAASEWQGLEWWMTQSQKRSQANYIGIQLINTTQREMPAGLEALAFDNALVKARFHALLDKLIGLYKGRIAYLSIGNEVDAYLRARFDAHDDQWGAYQRFYEDAVQYVHKLDPAIKVGVTATFDGALGQAPAQVKALNAKSDVLVLTYYPLQYDSSFRVTVRDPAVVADDFQRMLAVAGTRPLVLQEVGYPASAVNLSSEQKQAAFIRNVFAAWTQSAAPSVAPSAQRIPFLNFFPLHDFSAQMCADFTVYYGTTGAPGFTEFLCSLGLRKTDGTPRTAWPALLDAAKKANLP